MPIVLRVEAVVGIDLRCRALRIGAAAVGPAEQERCERTPAGERRGSGNARAQETEAGLTGNLLLSNPAGALALKRIAEFEIVFAAGVGEVVLDAPHWLFGAVERRSAPALKLAKTNDGKIH